MEHMQARQRLKQHHRARLGQFGLGFCDDNAARLQKLEQLYADARGTWEAEGTMFEPVIAAACHASTTDNELQTIDTTLRNDRLFWSSTGSQTQVADEALLYELDGPACQVHFIRMAVYRAFYQHGYPVYPPMQLQVWAGPSPHQLQPASQVYDVQATDALQTFALDPQAPAARFLQIRMYGKLQKQREDMHFYIAIRHISAVGSIIPSSQLLNLRVLLRSGACALNPAGQLPGSCCAGLKNMTGWGLGPWEAADGASAAGRVLDLPQQQQQQVLEQGGDVVEQLVIRQLQQQSRRTSKRPYQPSRRQQQQVTGGQEAGRSVFGGFLSSIGRGWRGSHAADAAGCSSSSISENMQLDTDDTAACGKAGEPQDAAAAAGHDGSNLPKWLWPDVADHSSSEQQKQQHHDGYVAKQPSNSRGSRGSSGQRGGSSSSDASESEQGYESDNDTDDQNMGRHRPQGAAGGWAAVNDMAGAAEQARMELMLWQALNRLPDPDDPVDREQLLAAWLEDEPLHSNIPAAFRQQMINQQLTGANGTQQLPGGWRLRPQLAVKCSLGQMASSSSVDQADSGAHTVQQQWHQTDSWLDHDCYVTCYADLSAELVLPGAAIAHLARLPAAAADTAAAALARNQQQSGAMANESEITADVHRPMHKPDVVRIPGSCLFSIEGGVGVSGSSSSNVWQRGCSWFDEGLEQDLFLHQQLLMA